jgi:tetratricopeptide (TPR) repeat protein
MSSVALIPFSTRLAEDHAAHIARGLTLDFSDWLKEGGTDPLVLTSAQTEEDGAWRKLVSFADELSAETVTEFVTDLARDGEGVEGDFALALSGLIEPVAQGTSLDRGLRLIVTVTDVAGGFSLGRFVAEPTQTTFREEMTRLLQEVAGALGLDASRSYDPGTRHYQVWLNLLVTRALILAAEVGAVPRDAGGLYEPALEAAQLDPGCAAVRDRLGELCSVLVLERGFEPRDAAQALERVMRRVGPDWKSHRVRGQLMLAAGDPSQAAKAFCQLLQGRFEAPDKADRLHAALMAGKAFNMAERHIEAQRVLRLAMEADNLKVDAIVESAASSAAMGETAVAERLWRRALELEPQGVAARVHLARYFRAKGNLDAAGEQYAALIKLPGLAREVFADAAEFFVVNQRHQDALSAGERYAEEHAGDAIAHVLHASALNAAGRHKRALDALERAELCVGVGELDDLVKRQRRFANHPESELQFRKLAGEAVDGNAAGAEQGVRELLAKWPDFWEAHMFLGIALRRQQRWAEARDVLEALRAKHALPGIDKELTGVYSQLGDASKVLECARRAMDATPEDPTLLTNYAAALLENNEVDEAMKYAQRAELLMPGDEPTQRLLGLIEMRMRKRGLFANFRAVFKEAASWLKATRRKKS